MKLQETFRIPAGKNRSWALLQDVDAVAGCLPGAQLTGVDGDTCTGRVKVKIGPIVMVYDGELEFTGRDAGPGRMTMRGRGLDKRGAGTVAAEVALTLEPMSADETTCSVDIDLEITGKPAQFGRSVIQDVSSRLVRQFADNLTALVDGEGSDHTGVPGAGTGQAARVPAGAGSDEPFDVLQGPRVRYGIAVIVAAGALVALLVTWFCFGRKTSR